MVENENQTGVFSKKEENTVNKTNVSVFFNDWN